MLKLLIIPLLFFSLVEAKSSYSSGSSSRSSSYSSSSGSKPSSYSSGSSSYKPSSSQQTVSKTYDKSTSATALDSYNSKTTTAATPSAPSSYSTGSTSSSNPQQPTTVINKTTVVNHDSGGGSWFNNFATGYIVSDMLHPGNHNTNQQPSTVIVNNGNTPSGGTTVIPSGSTPQASNQVPQCPSNTVWGERSRKCESTAMKDALGEPQPKKEESHTLLYLFLTLIGASAIYFVFFRKY